MYSFNARTRCFSLQCFCLPAGNGINGAAPNGPGAAIGAIGGGTGASTGAGTGASTGAGTGAGTGTPIGPAEA